MAQWQVGEERTIGARPGPPPPGAFANDMPPPAAAPSSAAVPGEIAQQGEPMVEHITAERPSAPAPVPKTKPDLALSGLNWQVGEERPYREPDVLPEPKRAEVKPTPPSVAPAKPGKEARGVRNNNPGNIVATENDWQGEVQGKDKRFASFDTPESGIRALAKQLKIYDDKHDVNTVRSIVKRWAPASDNNNVEAYVAAMTKSMGVGPNEPLDMSDPDTLRKATIAIIEHENGKNPYSDATINAGVNAALGIAPPVAPPLAAPGPPQPRREPDILPPNVGVPAAKPIAPAKTPEQATKFTANSKEVQKIVDEHLNPFGVAEVAVEGITNLFAALPGAALGIQQAIVNKDPQKFAEVMDFVREYYTEHPETASGKKLSAAMQGAMGVFKKLGDWIGDKSMSIDDMLDDVAGTKGKSAPFVAAFSKTITEGLPLLLPGLARGKPKPAAIPEPVAPLPTRVEPSATIPREMPPGAPEPAMGAEPSAASLQRPGEPTIGPAPESAIERIGRNYDRRKQEAAVEIERRLAERRAAAPAPPPPAEPPAPSGPIQGEPAPMAPQPPINWDRARAAAAPTIKAPPVEVTEKAPTAEESAAFEADLAAGRVDPKTGEPIPQAPAAPPEPPWNWPRTQGAIPLQPPPLPRPPQPPAGFAPKLNVLPPAKRGGAEFKDDRLQVEGGTEALRSMAARAGWAEQGGRLLRDPDGVVIGRTKWMPNEPWFAEMQRDKSTRMKPSDLREAVEKVIRGEKVSPQQARAVKYLLDENDRITKSFAKIEEEHGQMPHYQDDVLDSLHVTDLPASHENLADLSLIDKARAIDEDAFQRIPDQVDDGAFMAAVREIINADKSKTQEAAPGQSGPETARPETAAAGGADPLAAAGTAVYNPAAPAIKPRKRSPAQPRKLPPVRPAPKGVQ